MSKKHSILRKVLAVALSTVTLLGTGFTTAGQFVGTSISVSATQVYGDFEYEVNNDNTIAITKYTGNGGNVTIPSKIDGKSVTSISDRAFYSCTGLTSTTIPDSVIEIGEYAFYGCTGLTSITIPDSVTSIGWGAFYGCISLTSIMIPDSVTSIVGGAFAYCQGLTSIEIPNSVTSIGNGAFYCCTGLTSVTIPDSVTSIGTETFLNCKGLTSITIPNSVTSISHKVFWGCTGLTSIAIPNSVTSIGIETFRMCTSLTNITIPDSVTSIGKAAFEGCTGLTSITIGNSVTLIGGGAFYGCTGLTSVTIPDSVTSIGFSAFSKCTGLTSITIPDSVISIGSSAFDGCTGLTSITIPDSITTISYGLFSGCTNLTSITIPDSVISIGGSAFEDTKWYNNQPDGVVYFGKILYAYKGKMPENTRITVLYGTKSISGNGFWACSNLESIIIPESVTYIAKSTFLGCSNLIIYGLNGSYAEEYANNNDIMFVAIKNELKNLSTISENEIAFGNNVTIKVNADGGAESYTYAVYYKKQTESKWTTKQDFGTNDTVTIKPANATDYDICVKVKDGSGKIVKKYFELKVNPKLANTSTLSAENVTLGQQITVNGLAQGGMGEYQYQVVYKQTSQSKWTTAQAFSENATVTFKPAKATTYDVCVKVKDSNGTIVKKFSTVQVNAKLTNTSTVSATTIKKGNTVTVNGSATGGAGDYTYAVFYKQKAQTKWTTKQDFNENSDVSVKPAMATDYDICIKVKDKDGTIAKQYFTVTVTK